jgi:hypothetical protein
MAKKYFVIQLYEHNLFLVDFNVNLFSDSRDSLDFCEKIEDHALHAISKEPTHLQPR